MGESGELGERAQPRFSTVDPTVLPVKVQLCLGRRYNKGISTVF